MYEMEGPSPGPTAPAHRLLGRLTLPDLPTGPGYPLQRRFPDSSRGPEVAPRAGTRLR